MSARESDDRSVLHRDKREIPRRIQGTLERVFPPGVPPHPGQGSKQLVDGLDILRTRRANYKVASTARVDSCRDVRGRRWRRPVTIIPVSTATWLDHLAELVRGADCIALLQSVFERLEYRAPAFCSAARIGGLNALLDQVELASLCRGMDVDRD